MRQPTGSAVRTGVLSAGPALPCSIRGCDGSQAGMTNWPLWKKMAPIAALFAVYFPIALYVKHSYVAQPAPSKDIFWLTGPFLPLIAGGKAYTAYVPQFDDVGDSVDEPRRSPLVVYENDRPLGPPHSQHQDIIQFGGGLYSHWAGLGLLFSTTDGSNPNQNWKLYSIRKPDPQTMSHDGGGSAMMQLAE
jgi:hypothetical protein